MLSSTTRRNGFEHPSQPHVSEDCCIVRDLSRRQLLAGALGTLGVATLGACARGTEAVPAGSTAIRRAEAARQAAGQTVVVARLAPRPATLDLGGPIVDTWAYGDSLPLIHRRIWVCGGVPSRSNAL